MGLVANPDTVVADLGDGGVVVDLRTLRPTGLDRVGMAMWGAIAASSGLDAAVDRLLATFAADRAVLEHDLGAFASGLVSLGLLVEASGEGPSPRAGVNPAAVVEQRRRDVVAALAEHVRAAGVQGEVLEAEPERPDLHVGPIALLWLRPGSTAPNSEWLAAVCARVAPGGAVVVDAYDDPAWRGAVDAARRAAGVNTSIEIIDWSAVWWGV